MKHAALMALLTGKTPLDVIASKRTPQEDGTSAAADADAGAAGRLPILKRLVRGILGSGS